MKNEKEIKEKLCLLIDKRLKQRYKLKLTKNYHNCIYSNCLGRFYVCSNKNNLNNDKYVICDDSVCDTCKLYSCKYNKDNVYDEFIREISDPSICMQKEPKIAMLYWVLEPFKYSRKNGFLHFLKKLFLRG